MQSRLAGAESGELAGAESGLSLPTGWCTVCTGAASPPNNVCLLSLRVVPCTPLNIIDTVDHGVAPVSGWREDGAEHGAKQGPPCVLVVALV